MPIWSFTTRRGGVPALAGPCPNCGHDKSHHPRPGQANLTRCAACIWEEDTGSEETEDMCAERFARSGSL